jgi:hypothetical protein
MPFAALTALVAVAVALLLAPVAGAQRAARSLDIDTSVRASGMGSASNAVFWGDDPNPWANPALLAYHRGVRYAHCRTRLVPGLTDDVVFRTDRTTVSYAGVGLALPGTTRLDYGTSEAVDENGNTLGTFSSYEKAHVWGAGVSLGEAAGSLWQLGGRERPGFLDYADVALGMNNKAVRVVLAPGAVTSTTALDWGTLVRAGLPLARGSRGESPLLRLDASYGYSVLNFNDARVVFINEDSANPTSRIRRSGFAVRGAVGVPSSLRRAMHDLRLGWLAAGLDPLVSIGWAADHERVTAGSRPGGYGVQRWGVEIAFANVVSVRQGHVQDRLGDIRDNTAGYGVGFNLGRFGGVHWDHAHIPQARNAALPYVKRDAWSLFVDPIAIALALR